MLLLLFSRSLVSNSLQPPGLRPLSFTISWSLVKLMSFESVMPSNHLILCCSFSSCLRSFPASGSFPMSQLFASGAQTIGASATVLPKSIQDWFPLRLIGLISLLCKGLSTVFSSTTVRKHQSLGVLPSVLSSSHMSVHDYEKDHSLDNMNLCKQSNVFTF